MSIHEGHRERLKERFRAEGLDSFGERHVLELLLFYCVPRKDTAPLAQRLLDHFGSLYQVMEADIGELEKVEGVDKVEVSLEKKTATVSGTADTKALTDAVTEGGYEVVSVE